MKIEATKSIEDPMVQAFARAVESAGGKALLVGGLVRDKLLGIGDSKDYDFEVFGLPMEKVNEILKQFGNVKDVGEQFGILMIQNLNWDVALPRREMKTGEGHKGFEVVPDPTMSIEAAARRRDLTINSMSMDPLSGEIIDPLNGIADLQAGILRMADPNTFGDDPLRALRVAQFAARFDFDVEPETLSVMARQPLEQLPGERILPEFSKMLLKGKTPSKGIEVLKQSNLLRYFPEIEKLQGVPQDPVHHPEGDVYVHTLMVLDEAAKQRTGNPDFDLPLMLGALAHDFGKPDNTQTEEGGKIRALGHEEGGYEPTVAFLKRMKAPKDLTNKVAALVVTHLRPQLMPERAGRKGYRKLSRLLDSAGVSPELLAAVSKADTLGRTTEKALRRDTSMADKFLAEYAEHVTKTLEPGQKALQDAVTGKDLIARGMKPGPDLGKFLTLTRAIEDETGLKDADKIIDLAARFLSQYKKEGASDKMNKCGDSHIREGEECYDGNYREARKKGITKGSQGPSEFRTHPDPDQSDHLYWRSHFDWAWKDPEGEQTTHPGLGPARPLTEHSSVTAEPQRQHERSLKFQPRWFNSGTKWSERPPSGKGSRDGFSGSLPFVPPEQEHSGPPPIPKDHPQWQSVTPEDGIPGDYDLHGLKENASSLHAFNWDKSPVISDIGPEHRDEFPGGEFPTHTYPADKGAGYLAVELPMTQLLEGPEMQMPLAPMKADESEESRQSSAPGKFVRYPGGGGLDRAPMVRPQGEPKPTGFLPVVNYPDPGRNMFKAELDSDVDQNELKLAIKYFDEDPDVAVKNLHKDAKFYSKKPRNELDFVPNKGKNQVNAPEIESIEGSPDFGRGGQDPDPEAPLVRNKTGKGGHNGDDKSREYWDMDRTGKKPGFMSIEPPKENIYKASASRTMEDYRKIGTIFPKDYNPDWGQPGKPAVGPNTKHRNERKVAPDPIKGDDGILQKQGQQLVPNQKLSIAVNPNGPPGEKIVMMSPLFTEVSPAIQALRSQRFEDYGAVVIDGPPDWLLSLGPKLEALDRGASNVSSNDLWKQVLEMVERSGLTVDYTQEPKY